MFSTDFISRALSISLQQPLSTPALRIWTDSRSIQKGDLFAAIPGEKFDGHDYIKEAADKGAVGALASQQNFKDAEKIPKDFSLIYVEDVTHSLRLLAKEYRKSLSIPIFAVAGSNGKTTTKECMAFLLSKVFTKADIFKTEKSQNSILGIALSLLQIRQEKFAIIEIGIDEPGWMSQHLEVVQPTHGIITSIGEEHLNRLQSIERVAEEELLLLNYLRDNNAGFLANMDCPWISKEEFPKSSISYALDVSAQIEGKFLSPLTLSAFGIRFENPLPGKHNAQNLLSALAAIKILMPDKADLNLYNFLSKEVKDFRGEAHRSIWTKNIEKEIFIFDDCYNANPSSVEKSLQTFLEVADGLRKKIILGDMLDLGESTLSSHIRILNIVSVLGFDRIFLLGKNFKRASEKQNHALNPSISIFEDYAELENSVKNDLSPGDAILLKGSRGMKLERILPVIGSN